MDFATRLLVGAGLALVAYGLLHRCSPLAASVVAGAVACAALSDAPEGFLAPGPFGEADPWEDWDRETGGEVF